MIPTLQPRVTIGFCVILLASLAGCGSSSSPASPGSPATNATPEDVSTFQQLSNNVQAATQNYRSALLGATSAGTCQSAFTTYQAQVAPWISQMQALGGPLDQFMAGNGGAPFADVQCVMGMLSNEFNSYARTACSSSDLATEQLQATQYSNQIGSYTSHLHERGAEMGNVMGHHPPMSGPAWGPVYGDCPGSD